MPALRSAIIAVSLLFSGLAAAEEINSAPLFAARLANLDDKAVALENYRGKPLVVNFWARWCAPCRAEIPELLKFRQAHKGKIEILGIGIEEKTEPVKEFAKAYDMDYPVFVAKDQGIPLMQALGNSKGGLPYTVFLDGNGQVVQRKMGLVKPADLDEAAPLMLKK